MATKKPPVYGKKGTLGELVGEEAWLRIEDDIYEEMRGRYQDGSEWATRLFPGFEAEDPREVATEGYIWVRVKPSDFPGDRSGVVDWLYEYASLEGTSARARRLMHETAERIRHEEGRPDYRGWSFEGHDEWWERWSPDVLEQEKEDERLEAAVREHMAQEDVRRAARAARAARRREDGD